MPEEPLPKSTNRELTATIAAYVRQNQIAPDQLATLISTVHRALVGLGKPVTEAEVERTPGADPAIRSPGLRGMPRMWVARPDTQAASRYRP